ncbi:MAG TPA: P-loop NTPase fold protein, partial [Polyangiaceae bacterium]|nr:P-loop NTPase fold protein [Polyangiaceae bacterium]
WSYVEEELKPEQRKVRQSLEALHAVGQQTSDALQPVYKQIQSLTSTGGQVHAVLSGMIRAPDATRKLVELCGIMALPLIALVLLRTYGPQLPTLSTAIVGGIASSTAALARGVSWVRDRAQQTMEHLEPLIGFRDRVAAALEAAEAKKAAEVARNEREVAAKSAALEVAKREVRESESRVQSAIEALAAAVNGAGIARFIEQRLASSDYQKHLGLIALVRRDFEQLTQLIQGHNAQRLHLQEDAANIREALRRARPNLAEDELRASFENLGVNRVIIYIDDLDRCPSERVVEVLQAIHLLLAFPVFTVVVGVDARWMAHALSKEFPALLGTAAEKAGVEGNGRVSPSDYLEKIFQIPFWVPPLDELTTCALLDKLAGGRKNEATLAGYSPDDLFGEEGASFGSVQAGLGSGGDSHNSGTYPKLSESLSERSRSTQPGANGSEGDSPHPGLIRPVALALDKTEVQAMRELALVIGRSPRATKRFVNSYRLLKAALTDKERGELGLEPKSTSLNFEKLRTPMLLLAIVTGAPSLAARFLAANPPASASLQDKAPSPLEYLAELARQATSSVEVADTFARVRQFCGGPQRTRWADIEYGEIARWATRVSQFSFEDLASPLAESVA